MRYAMVAVFGIAFGCMFALPPQAGAMAAFTGMVFMLAWMIWGKE